MQSELAEWAERLVYRELRNRAFVARYGALMKMSRADRLRGDDQDRRKNRSRGSAFVDRGSHQIFASAPIGGSDFYRACR